MKLSKTSIIAAACLGAVALTSVGFAGWKIVADANNTQNGNITVYNITTDAVVISPVEWYDGNTKIDKADIVFGIPKEDKDLESSRTNTWYQYESTATDQMETECFPTCQFTLTDYSKYAEQPNITVTIAFDTSINDGSENLKNYYTCQNGTTDKNYIKGPALADKDGKKVTVNLTTSNGVTVTTDSGNGRDAINPRKYTVKIDPGFGWGDHFKLSDKAVNPYYYYGTKEYDDTNVKDASDVLGAIYKLKDLKYTLTIKASPNSGASA